MLNPRVVSPQAAPPPGFSIDLDDTEFAEMASDVTRHWSLWLSRLQREVRRKWEEHNVQTKEFSDDMRARYEEYELTVQREAMRIEEEQLRAAEEAAMHQRSVQGHAESVRRRLSQEEARVNTHRGRTAQRARLDQERFRQEYTVFEEDRQQIVNREMADMEHLEINVGGTVFESSTAILKQQPGSFLEAVFSGRYYICRDRYGRIAFDRDPDHFRTILNFLRNPELPPMPRTSVESEGLLRESEYYGIHFFKFPLVFALGGNDGSENLRAMEVLDVGSCQWRPCRPMQTNRCWFGAGTLQSKLFAFGGTTDENVATDTLEIYDCLRDTWIDGASMRQKRRGLASVELDGRMYAIGGYSGDKVLETVEIYDRRMKSWMQAPPMSIDRQYAMAAAKDHKVYVMGGTTATREATSTKLQTVECYDPVAGKWDPCPNMEDDRGAGQAATVVNYIFCCGGENSAGEILERMECMDGELGEFSARMAMIDPRRDFAACEISDHMLLGGGFGGDNKAVLQTTEFYRPELDDWQPGPDMLHARFGHQYVRATI